MFSRENFKIKVRIYPKPTSFDILCETPEERKARYELEAHPDFINLTDVLTYKTRNFIFKPSEIPEGSRCSHLSTSRRCNTGTCYLMEPGGRGYWRYKCDKRDEGGCDGHLYSWEFVRSDGSKYGTSMCKKDCFGKKGERVFCIEYTDM